jgi:hypothetical protein
MTLARAIAAIDRRGVLLVYPLQNRPDPPSLWSTLHPRSEMRWAWDEDADDRVVELWHMRQRLATSGKVVYAKWLGGRATFLSRDVFRSMLASFRARVGSADGGVDDDDLRRGLSRDAQDVLTALEEESPQGTKRLREASGLSGRALEGAWNRALKELWSRLLVVGVGEEAEGGFPSLQVGATRLLFEDLWEASATFDEEDEARIAKVLAGSVAITRAYRRVFASLEDPERAGRPVASAPTETFEDEDPNAVRAPKRNHRALD